MISTLGIGGTIAAGRYIPVSFLPLHNRARCEEQGDLIQAGEGTLFSNVRKKRGRCRECSLNTKYQCRAVGIGCVKRTENMEGDAFMTM